MNQKQGNGRWPRFGRRNSAPDEPIMGVIPNMASEAPPSVASVTGMSDHTRSVTTRSRGKASLRGSFEEAKPYVPSEEISSLTALPPSKSGHGRNINLVPEDFPSLGGGGSVAKSEPPAPAERRASVKSSRSNMSVGGRPQCRRNSSKSSSRSSYVPPTEGISTTSSKSRSLGRGSPASQKSRASRSTASTSEKSKRAEKPQKPEDGNLEISVYRKPDSKRLEEHDKDIAKLQREKRDEDKTETTEGSTPPRRRREEFSLKKLPILEKLHDPYGQYESNNDDSTNATNENPCLPGYGPPFDHVNQPDNEKRWQGLTKDKGVMDTSWRTSRTGISSRTLQTTDQTLASRSHVSVRQLEVDPDPSTSSTAQGRWLPQQTRWEESNGDLTSTTDLGGLAVDWTPSTERELPPLVSVHSQGKSLRSVRSSANETSVHSGVSASFHSKKDGMPRKPRHSKCRSPTREVEWSPQKTIDVPPSQSKSGRSGRRSRLSPERVREIEIAWSPGQTNNSDRVFSAMSSKNDNSPTKPSRYWKPPPKMEITRPLVEGDGSRRTFDRMMEQAIQRSMYDT